MSSSGILKNLENSFHYLVSDYEFSIVTSNYYEEHFGNAIVEYSNGKIAIKIIRDRGQYFVRIKCHFDKDEFDEDIIYRALNFRTDSEILIKAQWEDLSLSSRTLRKHIEDIMKNFSEENYSELKNRMKVEQQKRVKELFPKKNKKKQKTAAEERTERAVQKEQRLTGQS